MKGQHEIIALRLAGYRPEAVFWDDDGDSSFLDLKNAQKPYFHVDPFKEMVTDPCEPVSSMDLRFLVDLNVHISTMDENRLQDLMAASLRYARRVTGCAHRFIGLRPETYFVAVQEKGKEMVWQRF